MKWYSWQGTDGPLFSGAEFAHTVHWARHAFLNDLQVLSGWLELHRPDTAAEYLHRTVSRLTADSVWSALAEPDLEAALFLFKAEAASAGVLFTASVSGFPEAAYLRAAAASSEMAGQPRPAGPFAVAVLGVLRAVLRRSAASQGQGAGDRAGSDPSRGSGSVAAAIEVSVGRLAMTVDLPGPGPATGLEDELLLPLGFGPVAAPDAGRARDGQVRVGIALQPGAGGATGVTLTAAW